MLASSDWPEVATAPTLFDTDVHVWRAFLNVGWKVQRDLEATLSDAERLRASRFVRQDDRARFVSRRGILRLILAKYVGLSASQLTFASKMDGKPHLEAALSGLTFNVSHSEDAALYAVAQNREIGIDIEVIRAAEWHDDIVERLFSSSERAELAAAPPNRRSEAFLNAWTRKEAYLKALGSGLRTSLDSFTVSLSPARTDQFVSSDGGRWTLHSFTPANGYIAAVAAEGDVRFFGCFSFAGISHDDTR